MQIRQATTDDIPALRTIAADAYAQYVELIGRKPAPMVASFDDHLQNDIIFVATVPPENHVAGYAVIVNKADGFWLESIAVASDSAGHEIGTGLIAHVEAYLASRTASYQLYTNVKMARNILWYQRLGFAETGRGVEAGFERVYFRKTLST